MKRFTTALVAVTALLALTACEPTQQPVVGDDATALDLRLTLDLRDEHGTVVENFGVSEVTLAGIASNDPDTGEERHVDWIDYHTPDPSSPDGWRHVPDVLEFLMDTPGFENQRIRTDQVIAVTFTATIDLFLGWTFSCTLSNARTGQEFDKQPVTNPLDSGEPVVTETVICAWP